MLCRLSVAFLLPFGCLSVANQNDNRKPTESVPITLSLYSAKNGREKKRFFDLPYLVVYASILIFLLVDTANDRRRLGSFFGLKAFVLLAVLFSNNPARIR